MDNPNHESKPDLTCFIDQFPLAMEAIARVHDYNRGPLDKGDYLPSLLRHLFKHGEHADHDAALAWNAIARLEMRERKRRNQSQEMDDAQMTFWYLASPYTKYAAGRGPAYMHVCREAGRLVNVNIPVYSPIAHFHGIDLYSDNELSYEVLLAAQQPFIDIAYGLIVLKLNGWEDSFGVDFEIKQFTISGKPIIYMEPGIVPQELLTWGSWRK